MTRAPLPRLGLVLLAGLSVAWGANWPIMKIALQEIPLWTFRAGSAVTGALCLLAIARATGAQIRPAPGEWKRLLIAALFNVSLWHVLVAYGTLMMPSGHASVLGFTMPLWAALIGAAVLGEGLTLRIATALMLGVGGIAVLLSRDLAAVGASPLGATLVLLAAFGWAIGTVYQKRQRWTVGTLAIAGWQLLLGALPIIAILPFVEGLHMPRASTLAWACAIYVTLVSLVFAYFAWFKIVSLFPANIAAIGTLLTPAIAVVSGALILDEPFGLPEMAALALILGALTLVLIVPAARPRATAASAE